MNTSLIPTSSLFDFQSIRDRYAHQLNKPDYNALSPSEQAQACQDIILYIGQTGRRLTEMLLETLWEVQHKALWVQVSETSFLEWADDISSGFDESMQRQFRAAAKGADRVLSLVYERANMGDPILDTEGQPITVERMLKKSSYVRTYSFHVATSKDPEMWVRTICSGTMRDLEALKDYENPRSLIPVNVRKEGDCYRLELLLSPEQFRVFENLNRKFASFPLVEGV